MVAALLGGNMGDRLRRFVMGGFAACLTAASLVVLTPVAAQAASDPSKPLAFPVRGSVASDVVSLALTPTQLLGVDVAGNTVTPWSRTVQSSWGTEIDLRTAANTATATVVASGGRWSVGTANGIQQYDLAQEKGSLLTALGSETLLRQSGPYLLTSSGRLINPAGTTIKTVAGAYDVFGGLVLTPNPDRDGFKVVDDSGAGAATISKALNACTVQDGRIRGDWVAIQCQGGSVQLLNFRTANATTYSRSGTLAALGDGFVVLGTDDGLQYWQLGSSASPVTLSDTSEDAVVAVEGDRIAYTTNANTIVVKTLDLDDSLEANQFVPRVLGIVAPSAITVGDDWAAEIDLSRAVDASNGTLELDSTSLSRTLPENLVAGEAIRTSATSSAGTALNVVGTYALVLSNQDSQGNAVHLVDGTPNDAVGASLFTVTVKPKPMDAAPVPTLNADTATVGTELGATVGTWTAGSATPSLAYQWLADGTPISGQTGLTYTPAADVVGKAISFQVTGTATGYATTTRTSEPTSKVVQPTTPVGAVGTVTVSSQQASVFVLGEKLTAEASGWSTAPTFVWLRDGKAITGATDSTYTTTSSDLKHTISVKATSADGSATSSGKVVLAPVPKTAKPTTSGKAVFGATLKAKTGSWTSKTKLTYRWLRDGESIAKATGSSYRVGSADVGHRLSIAVTGTLTGYAPVTRTSSQTAKAAPATFSKQPVPKISGTAKVGRKLSVVVGTWKPKPGFSYQWLRAGAAIGATGRSYTPVAADVGKKLTVAVTATLTGYRSVTRTSKSSAKVAG